MRAIDGDALKNKNSEWYAKTLFRECIADENLERLTDIINDKTRTAVNALVDSMPTIEPERKKGKWIEEQDYMGFYVCSECRYKVGMLYSFCPHCGAYMRGDAG